MIDTLLTEVRDITDKEYQRANKKFPAFASDHEGHDVFCEEVMEAVVEMARVKGTVSAMAGAIQRKDDYDVAKIADVAYNAAEHLAAEAVQVAAMAKKITASQELRKSDKWVPPCRLV